MATKYEYYDTGFDAVNYFDATEWAAQTFTPSEAHKITSVKLFLQRLGSPGTITIGIRATDGSGHPTGGDLCSGTTDGNTLPSGSQEWREITLGAGYSLEASVKYAIVARCVGSAPSNYTKWGADNSSPTYVGGNWEKSTNSGVDWTTWTGTDYMFEEWGELPVSIPTVTTQAVDNINKTTATGHGTITDDGGETPSAWGVCVAETENPDTGDTVFAGSGAGEEAPFTAAMTSLTPGQLYYVRAYATNSEGTSYGGQVEFTTNKDATDSDSGSGADVKASENPLATYSRSETGGGVDGHKAVAPQSVGETGLGVDALTALLGILARSETGLGADAKLSLAVALIKADTGSGLEHILDRALVLISESGSGLDVSHLVKTLMLSDGGTCILENSYLHILEGVKDSHETGSGVDASSLAALFQRDETGEGVEAVVARALYAKEYPTGALDFARVLMAAITGAETGTGAEASLLAFYQKKTDSGEGVDSSSLVGLFTGEDSGAGAEAITLLAAMVAQDTGVSVESVLTFLKKAIDSGQGVEVVNIIGAVGRAMKLITYLRAYSDLVVYTRPFSDLKVYTSEVKQQ